MDNHRQRRPKSASALREFWLRMLIPAVLLTVLVVVLIGNRPHQEMASSFLVVGLGLLASAAVGVLSGVNGPSWAIYVLIVLEVGLLLLLPAPWQGLALISVPVSAIGFMMGREIAFLRINRTQRVPPTT